ncbi:unnamed protein product [Bursaphelenchus okinawaensis]|uniref:F-box domain-containing protein n=1 Tax=Bursaphelenchus okinawaensis TaxID=465554 RepID=A0A811KUC7_9BILA|nr:unnamed protein product [Bursaphelenchus okinawaensis]CAG9111971.1 unnamed protein product [Bursaphelenchus okinawaensis]
MRVLLGSLPVELRIRVIKYIENMEEISRLATISKFFYRLINIDFQILCFKNSVYRLAGETWSEAFSNTNYRTLDVNIETCPALKIKKHSMCCPYTGTVALILEDNRVLITNIDFAKKVFEIIDFRSVEGTMANLQLINKSTKLLVDMTTSYVVYDLVEKEITKVYSALKEERYYSFTLYYREGILVDLYNQKEYKVKTAKPQLVRCIVNADLYGYREYVGYVNYYFGLVTINNYTGEQTVIYKKRNSNYDTIRILDGEDQVMVQGGRTYVFDILTKGIENDYGSDDKGLRDYRLIDLKYFHNDKNLVGYCEKKKKLTKLAKWPYELRRGYIPYAHADLLPQSTTHRIEEGSLCVIDHFGWSSGRLVSKKFRPLESKAVGFNYLKLAEIKVEEGELTEDIVNKARQQFELIIHNLSTGITKEFSALHISKVPRLSQQLRQKSYYIQRRASVS